MFLRKLALIVIFLVRIGFPSRLSLLQVIRNRYGGSIVTLVRKFEMVDFKHRKAAPNLNSLQTCWSFIVCSSLPLAKVSQDHKLTKSV